MRLILALFAALAAAPVFAQQAAPTTPAWPYPPLTAAAQPTPFPPPPDVGVPPPAVVAPPNPIPTGLPERPAVVYELPPISPPLVAGGQQHWVSVNLCVFQPFAGRLAVKVWPRVNNSLWLEAYYGSVLFDFMYGFGVRLQHTLFDFGGNDRIMLSPGLGVQILPNWLAYDKVPTRDPWGYNYYYWDSYYNSVFYVFGDIDISWLHDFSPHFGFELGVKVGLAGRVGGNLGNDYPRSVTWGSSLYPVFSLYSGFRF